MKLFTALVFYLFINFSSFAQTSPKVISAFPSNQVINAAANTEIIITFDSPIDPATITDTSIYIFGRWSGIAEGIFLLIVKIKSSPSVRKNLSTLENLLLLIYPRE